MRHLLVSILIFLSSCLPQKVLRTNAIDIALAKTECGSFAVLNSRDTIGFVVLPLFRFGTRAEEFITSFEKMVTKNYSDFYDDVSRQYWFSSTRANDTTMFVVMLSSREKKLIPNWMCEEQDVDVYNQVFRGARNADFPSTFYYNCSKGRLAVPGED